MGWRDREYARWTDEERRRFLGSSVRSSPPEYSDGPRTPLFRSGYAPRPVNGALLAVVASLGIFLLGHVPRGHPLIPALRFHVPGLPHAGPAKPPSGIGKIALPPVVPVGSFLTLHGTLPAGETGTVSVEGAYRGPPWRLLATVPAADGSYAARIRVDRRGLLHLRVTYPDGYRAVGSVHIR